MWLFFLFVKQKTAYEMRISDWSSDVCSSDLEKKNGREARVGSFNIAGAKAGVMDKDRIAFSYDKVGPGVFKVSPEQALAPGEYGFLYFMGGGGGAGMQAAASTTRVFDFSVTEAAGGKH